LGACKNKGVWNGLPLFLLIRRPKRRQPVTLCAIGQSIGKQIDLIIILCNNFLYILIGMEK
jgi:hypothetical protein